MTMGPRDPINGALSEDLETIISDDPLYGEMPEEYQTVIDHIMFHKALMDDDSDGEKFNDYEAIIKDLQYGTHVAITDPYDKYIAITFQLVIDEKLNPWNIDLVKFSEAYIERIKEHDELNLITAGRIIYMAWVILKKKSEKVLFDAENTEEEDDTWFEPSGDWFTDDMDFGYTMAIKNSPKPHLQEMIRRKGNRPVTLLELVGAFEEARAEAEILKVLNEKRRLQRDRESKLYKARINQNMHKEDLEADINLVYERICQFNGYPIAFTELCDNEPEVEITTFVSSLYLANRRKINIWQKDFPYGKIFIENLKDKKDRAPPLPGSPAEDSYYWRGRVKNEEEASPQSEIIVTSGDKSRLDKKKEKRKKPEIDEIYTSKKGIAS